MKKAMKVKSEANMKQAVRMLLKMLTHVCFIHLFIYPRSIKNASREK
jgi:hypothetical protein